MRRAMPHNLIAGLSRLGASALFPEGTLDREEILNGENIPAIVLDQEQALSECRSELVN